ncbi:MAG: cyclic lactone autoinducer peptide [Bacillota bacterium]|nr:cyclic lactone autoinducer peptide [Bacillota bacterium]
MKNRISKLVLNATANVCVLVANSTSASACLFSFYQPKEPKSLKKDK